MVNGLSTAATVLLIAFVVLLDGEVLVRRLRQVVPRRFRDARGPGRSGLLLGGRHLLRRGRCSWRILAGVYVLTLGLVLGVPLAPIAAVWYAVVSLIPQIGGFLGVSFFTILALSQGVVIGLIGLVLIVLYMNAENYIISPAIVGKSVNLSPPTTMLAALVGGAALGVPGALAATPLFGTIKALYLEYRFGQHLEPESHDRARAPEGAAAGQGPAPPPRPRLSRCASAGQPARGHDRARVCTKPVTRRDPWSTRTTAPTLRASGGESGRRATAEPARSRAKRSGSTVAPRPAATNGTSSSRPLQLEADVGRDVELGEQLVEHRAHALAAHEGDDPEVGQRGAAGCGCARPAGGPTGTATTMGWGADGGHPQAGLEPLGEDRDRDVELAVEQAAPQAGVVAADHELEADLGVVAPVPGERLGQQLGAERGCRADDQPAGAAGQRRGARLLGRR